MEPSDQLVAAGTVTKAAICGLDGSIWAASPGLDITAAEIAVIVASFSSPEEARDKGLFVAAEKYFFLGGSDKVVRGRKGDSGVHIAKTTQAIIVSVYESPIKGGACAQTTEALQDYLTGIGY